MVNYSVFILCYQQSCNYQAVNYYDQKRIDCNFLTYNCVKLQSNTLAPKRHVVHLFFGFMGFLFWRIWRILLIKCLHDANVKQTQNVLLLLRRSWNNHFRSFYFMQQISLNQHCRTVSPSCGSESSYRNFRQLVVRLADTSEKKKKNLQKIEVYSSVWALL